MRRDQRVRSKSGMFISVVEKTMEIKTLNRWADRWTICPAVASATGTKVYINIYIYWTRKPGHTRPLVALSAHRQQFVTLKGVGRGGGEPGTGDRGQTFRGVAAVTAAALPDLLPACWLDWILDWIPTHRLPLQLPRTCIVSLFGARLNPSHTTEAGYKSAEPQEISA